MFHAKHVGGDVGTCQDGSIAGTAVSRRRLDVVIRRTRYGVAVVGDLAAGGVQTGTFGQRVIVGKTKHIGTGRRTAQPRQPVQPSFFGETLRESRAVAPRIGFFAGRTHFICGWLLFTAADL